MRPADSILFQNGALLKMVPCMPAIKCWATVGTVVAGDGRGFGRTNREVTGNGLILGDRRMDTGGFAGWLE